jgi:hypothetical protein
MANKISRNTKPCWCGENVKYKNCCWPELPPESKYIERIGNPNTHGTQPIKVLAENIIFWFEKTHSKFRHELNTSIKQYDLKPGVSYINSETPLRDFAAISNDKKIIIEESFLSFLWINCYCFLVLYDEGVAKPRNRQHPDKEKISKAYRLFEYGLSLKSRFSDWKIDELPNPQKYLKEDKFYVEKANSIFLHAINFVMCHEYGHFKLGHVDYIRDNYGDKSKEKTDAQIKQDEIDADLFSCRLLLSGAKTKSDRKNIAAGLVAGLCSLIFLSSNLTNPKYPDADHRLKNALEQINPNEKDHIWGIACLALKMWSEKNAVNLELPNIVDTYKVLFYKILKQLESHK